MKKKANEKKKVLIVDDEKKVRDILKKFADFEGFEPVFARDGFEAIEQTKSEKPSIIILDVMMPGLDGFSAAEKIRAFSSVPIIMLSARGEEYDKLFGFELGIDDYVVKPFSPKELFMRVNAVLSRVESGGADGVNGDGEKTARKIISGDIEIDEDSRTVSVKKTEVRMTAKEYDLFAYLVESKGRALSRGQIVEAVWGYESFGGDRTVDTHIKTLRKKLGKSGERIETLRGYGYKFN